jgi:hypothetical protein
MFILPKLSRNYILENLSQEDILARYLNLSVSEVSDCLENGKLITSPLRSDRTPTFGFYRDNSGRVRGNDFAGYFHGDCFDVVGYQHHLDADDKVEFAIIMDIVAKDFSLWYYAPEYSTADFTKKSAELRNKFLMQYSDKEYTRIDIPQERTWVYSDSLFWTTKYRLEEAHLKYYDVHLPYVVRLNNKVIYTYNPKDPCYAYFLGYENEKTSTGVLQVPIWKLYFPYRTNFRFITNGKKMQGLRQVHEAPFGLLTKALKDTMCLKRFSVPSCSVAGETIEPTPEQIKYLYSKWPVIYSLMDFDYAGIRMAQILKRKYGIKPLFFTNGRYNTLDFESKDFSDFTETYSHSTVLDFVLFLKEHGVETDGDFYDYVNYNIL